MRSFGIGVWRLCERLGIDIAGATEGPRAASDVARSETFEELIAAARAGDGTVDTAGCPYPVHELLTHLVDRHRLLLHGSNHTTLEALEPQPAQDWDTAVLAVVACDDGIWPMFYAVVDRSRIEGIFTACMHLGRSSRRRRFYLFAVGGDPAAPTTWTDGVVYALPREGFRRQWGHEWVNPDPVCPQLRIQVRPSDFPLRGTVVGLSSPEEFRHVGRHLRAAKRERAASP